MLIIINSISVQAANRLNIVFLICKVLTILTIIIVGIVRLGQGLCVSIEIASIMSGMLDLL